jgi:hypothetical protein
VQYISTRSLQNPISGSEVETRGHTLCVVYEVLSHPTGVQTEDLQKPDICRYGSVSGAQFGASVLASNGQRLTETCVILRKHCQNIVLMLKTSLHCDVGFSPDAILVSVHALWKLLVMPATDLRWNGKSWFLLHMEREGFAEDFVGWYDPQGSFRACWLHRGMNQKGE